MYVSCYLIQHPAVAVFTCTGEACCAIGIALVWRRSWNKQDISALEDSNIWTLHFDNLFHRRTGRNTGENPGRPNAPKKPGKLTISMGQKAGTRMDQSTSEELSTNESFGIAGSEEYILRLMAMDKSSMQCANTSFGEISHLRCSPDGKRVAICHKNACVIYSIQASSSVSGESVSFLTNSYCRESSNMLCLSTPKPSSMWNGHFRACRSYVVPHIAPRVRTRTVNASLRSRCF